MKPNTNWMLYGWHGQQTEREGQAICCAKIRPFSVFQFPGGYKIDKKYLSAALLHWTSALHNAAKLSSFCATQSPKKETRRRAIRQDNARLNGYLMWIKHYNTCWCSCPNQDSWCLTNANRGGTQVFCVLRCEHLTTVCCYYLLQEDFFSCKQTKKTRSWVQGK